MLDLGGVHAQNLTIYSLASSSGRLWFELNAKVKLIMTMLALVGLPMDLIRGNLDTASEKKPHSFLWKLLSDTWNLNLALVWLCSNLVYIIPDKAHLSGHIGWLLVQTLLSGNWCPSRLSTRPMSMVEVRLRERERWRGLRRAVPGEAAFRVQSGEWTAGGSQPDPRTASPGRVPQIRSSD